jgi:hypothetical protein
MAVLHTIKAWLFDNQLTEDQNDLTARVSAERTLSVGEICASAVERGGADIHAAAMEHAVELFHREMAYRLCDGFSVNTGWYNVSTHLKGVFAGPTDPYDPRRHTVAVEFRQGVELRRELGLVSVEILGRAEPGFFIAEVTDLRTGSVNDLLTPGRNLRIIGGKLKVESGLPEGAEPDKPGAADDPCGVSFVNQADGSRVKVDGADLVENQNARLLIVIPPLEKGTYRLEVTTRYSGGSKPLKTPRTPRYAGRVKVFQPGV